MTQTLLETSDPTRTLARRRELPTAPVLIRVPVVVASRASKAPAGRRRLRREVRMAGYALILAVPACLAFLGLGGQRLPSLAASALGVAARVDPVDPVEVAEAPRERQSISLSLEPSLSAHQVREHSQPPVLLSGHLLPVDSHEEPSHGGH